MPASIRAALIALLALTAVSCSDVTTEVIGQRRGTASNGARDGSASDSQVDGDAAAALATACDGHPCQCNDGQDEDGDGLIDGLDPECTGPFDDDETSFGTGHLATASTSCQDCFWDDNEDGADDGCAFPNTCTLTSGGVADPACNECSISDTCVERCRPSTPNGCDCFGCCEVTTKNGSVVNVLLVDGCSVMHAEDERVCPRCNPYGRCHNPCGSCELCLGRKRRDLPQSCRGHPNEDPTPTCDDGERPCSETDPCPFPYYCQLGCCLVKVI